MNIRRQKGNFQFEEAPFSKSVRAISKVYHEVLLLIKFSQRRHEIRKMNIIFYDLFYAVVKNRVE